MAKSDSFFIRAKATGTGGNFTQTTIDLGSYVDALGKSVLRIHNVAVQTSTGTMGGDWAIPAGTQTNISYQLTTQDQAALVDATDKSLIASGRLDIANAGSGSGYTFLNDSGDILPQHWSKGYLVAVEQIYLGVDTDPQLATGEVAVVLECSVETLSQNAAMALALSQQ